MAAFRTAFEYAPKPLFCLPVNLVIVISGVWVLSVSKMHDVK